MTDEIAQPATGHRHQYEWRIRFFSRLDRLKHLMLAKWWVIPAALALGLGAAAILHQFQKPLYRSAGRMIVSMKLSLPEGSVYTEELSNFLGTQIALMQSDMVLNRAFSRLAGRFANAAPDDVELHASALPRTSIFLLQASGTDPEYVRAFLQASMEEYVSLKREMRTQTSDTTLAGLTDEVLRLQKELQKADDDLARFQSSNSVVLLQEQGNTAGTYLATLNQRLAALKSEHELLKALTLDEDLERRQQTGSILPTADDVLNRSRPSLDASELDYLKAKQQIALLNADRDDLGRYLRPKHPKMIALSEEISRREKLLEIFRQQSAQQLDNRKNSLALQIKNLERDVQEWDARNLEISRKTAEYQRLKSNAQRVQALYDRLLATMQTLDVNKEISPESVTIMEKASPPLPLKATLVRQLAIGAAAGLALGVILLLALNRLDDRITSLTELQDLFDEEVLAQVPRERTLEKKSAPCTLLQPEDDRYSLTEAYRNLRSSLLYIGENGSRPRTLLVTSSIPGEGKSMTAGNLAITLANSGSRVLLVDGDLRKGLLHERLKLPAEPGLSNVLTDSLDWKQAVRPTATPNLWLLPRGPFSRKSSELFITQATHDLLKRIRTEYDYVVVDSPPVMAADDVTSLAPHVDGAVFVIRAEHTSARIARAAMDVLYQRQAGVLGILFNAVRPNTSDYYYYKYKDYYTSYPSKA